MCSYSLDGIAESKFEVANIREDKQLAGLKSMEFYAYQLKVWEKIYGPIDKVLIRKLEGEISSKSFKREGIVFEFSKLKNDKDINKFANKYGLLGIAGPTPEIEYLYTQLHQPEDLPLEHSDFEPIQIWWYFIKLIRKNLKLYRALVNNHHGEKVEIEDNILKLEPIKFENQCVAHYWVTWNDGSQTGVQLTEEEAENLDFIAIGMKVLKKNILKYAYKNIEIDGSKEIKTNKPPLGITIQEDKVTPHLLIAIYYDFWKLISINKPVYICENPNCKLPYPKVKRQKYCSNACKQEHYRIRKDPEKYGYTKKEIEFK